MKKCPHCGGRALYGLQSGGWWMVYCLKCRSSTGDYHEKEAAKKAWDKRYKEEKDG